MDLLAQLAGFVVTASCAALVVVRAATAPAPPPPKHATPQEMRSFALSVSASEDDWRAKSAEQFPSDNWSQRDDFHGREAQMVRDLAGSAGVPYEDVFRAIDDDVHRSAAAAASSTAARARTDRSANAVPCHPRPVFD